MLFLTKTGLLDAGGELKTTCCEIEPTTYPEQDFDKELFRDFETVFQQNAIFVSNNHQPGYRNVNQQNRIDSGRKTSSTI